MYPACLALQFDIFHCFSIPKCFYIPFGKTGFLCFAMIFLFSGQHDTEEEQVSKRGSLVLRMVPENRFYSMLHVSPVTSCVNTLEEAAVVGTYTVGGTG